MRCKHYYELIRDNLPSAPTAVNTWRKTNEKIAANWETSIKNIYKNITLDNKLRQFYFKLLHRILITRKELKRFGITDNDRCTECGRPDSLEHSFLQCQATLGLYNNILQRFNAQYKTCLYLSAEEVFLNIYDPNPNNFTSQMNQIPSESKMRSLYDAIGSCAIRLPISPWTSTWPIPLNPF